MEAQLNMEPQPISMNGKKSNQLRGTFSEGVFLSENTPIPEIVPEIQNNIVRVRDVDWTNPNIYRAGIVPICIENGYKWIGLGVSKFSGNITTIGGSYEVGDYDLLSTAVREFNEEVGDNMRHLIEDAVYNCYSVHSDYSPIILLPISRRPIIFKETEELFDLMWVTPHQLRIMAANQEYGLFQSKRLIEEYPSNRGHSAPTTRAFVFSIDLKFLAEGIANAVEDGKCFIRPNSTEGFVRPQRVTTVMVPKISTSIEEFMFDSTNYKAWGNTALVITPDIIGLMRRDRTVYLLCYGEKQSPSPGDFVTIPAFNLGGSVKGFSEMQSIVDGLNRSHTKTHVALSSDLSHPLLSKFGSQIRLASIESDMRRTRISQINFLTDLQKLRNPSELRDPLQVDLQDDLSLHEDNFCLTRARSQIDRIINELNLIISYEGAIYEAIQQQGFFFNEKRGCFLKAMTIVNRILEKQPRGMFYRKLKLLLTESYTCRNPPSYMVINIMIETGLIHQNRNSTDVYIP